MLLLFSNKAIRLRVCVVLAFFSTPLTLALASAPTTLDNPEETEDVTVLPPFHVKGVQMEDFGFRFNVTIILFRPDLSSLVITEVLPNTAAAKAGLRPGEVVSKIDGKSVSLWAMALKPAKLQERKWAELEAGKKSVTLCLEVRPWNAKEVRTVNLVLPSPAPHWGSEKWVAPEGRAASVVKESGPLAALSREVLDNGSWSGWQDHLGYGWRFVQASGSRRIWVTQGRGKTEITLERRSSSPDLESSRFLTSPSGMMEEGHCVAPRIKGKRRKFSADEVRAQFEAEIDFWLNKVGRVTGRWPFELLPGQAEANFTSGPPGDEPARAPAFLKLPTASAAQRELFQDAMGKIGLDADEWAFTETSRSFDDAPVTTVRYDPSKPLEERCTLLKVDGKAPKAAFLNQWRLAPRLPAPGLGDLPPLSSVVDVNDLRIHSVETTSVVFELPVKSLGAEFPAEKFVARFRVNKALRGFEDFSVKLREPMRIAGIASMTDAGLEARFQTPDPTLAPQPVYLKMGGGARVLLVKVSRSVEVTRTDFKRVVPLERN